MSQVKRRHRLTLVCTNCKRRKSRCDRGKPACGNCIRLGNRETCQYFPAALGTEGEFDEVSIDSNVSCLQNKWQFVRIHSPNMVDLMAGKILICGKRSATWIIDPLGTEAIQNRDVYLELFNIFVHVSIRKTIGKLRAISKSDCQQQGRSLPNSVKHLMEIDNGQVEPESSHSLLSKHQKVYRSLFEKYANNRFQLRKQFCDTGNVDEDNELVKVYLVDKQIFLQKVWPHFKRYILYLIPIYDPEVLLIGIQQLYKDFETNGKLSSKNHDFIIFATILLITRLVQLSIRFDKCTITNAKYNRIADIKTEAYVAVVNHCLLRFKIFRKVTLPQLQCLLLLRFHNWSSPMDGDGEALQYSNVLMGTIYASCLEMGINWLCMKCPSRYDFENIQKKQFGLKSEDHVNSGFETTDDDLMRLYQQIWAVVLHWDRNLSLLTGKEPIIGKSLKFEQREVANWHVNMISTDYLKWSLLNIISDSYNEVDLTELTSILKQLKNQVAMYAGNSPLDFEQELILQAVNLSLVHAAFIESRSNFSSFGFSDVHSELVERIIHLAKLCFHYFYDPPTSEHQYSRFYTNKIVEVVLHRLCNIMPGLVLRISGSPKAPSVKAGMVRFYYNLCSLYFNELGYDYYQVLKRLFESKVKYKIIEQSNEPLEIMFGYLVHEVAQGNQEKLLKLEFVKSIYEEYKSLQDENNNCDLTKLWKQLMPFEEIDENNEIWSLFGESTFLEGKYEEYNLFSSFYDYASKMLTEDTKLAATLPLTEDISAQSATQLNIENGRYQFDLLEGILDPLDFISWLDDATYQTIQQSVEPT
ncbi:Oaf3p Ecym_5183 [Eremothecium cymbalariae DBVPG|uniref:Oleate activated transcription factor 3 n=1 Tax=Eremothecium cymbalariae (strain CBS 270.75 / DBVPG 7215 / KCTC 17166 / NRRL Y-17582) TaxID=931890 RepID=I6ND14_ERECY|nr:hypothetical protein Ecym_5183 [Eremothecium cymbalariae DBVPG\